MKRKQSKQNSSDHCSTDVNGVITQQLRSNAVRIQAKAFLKTDSRYWKTRLRKTKNGRGEESPNWSMPICFKLRRLTFSLRTPNKDAAAIEARNIYNDLVSLGVEPTLAKYRPDAPKVADFPSTIGAWIAAAEQVFDGRPSTFGGYARSLRLIAGDILSVSKSKKRFAGAKKSAYRTKIEEAPLTILTPEAIQAWRIRFVGKAGNNPALQRTKRISANSLIRQARSLFSEKMLKFIKGIQLPSPVPFHGCEMFPRESMRYNSTIDLEALFDAASRELLTEDSDAFVALLLGIGAALRRSEMDKLLWRQVDFASGVIRVEATEVGALKTEDSAGCVPIEEEVISILRGHYAKAKGPFVIGGADGDSGSREWGQMYRCGAVFDRLIAWLRRNGVNTPKPLHTLRKEAGSLIATNSGIYAASRFLRHADIQITAMHYADQKDRVSVGIGRWLSLNSPQITFIDKPAQTTAPIAHAKTKTKCGVG
jgi:integrase